MDESIGLKDVTIPIDKAIEMATHRSKADLLEALDKKQGMLNDPLDMIQNLKVQADYKKNLELLGIDLNSSGINRLFGLILEGDQFGVSFKLKDNSVVSKLGTLLYLLLFRPSEEVAKNKNKIKKYIEEGLKPLNQCFKNFYADIHVSNKPDEKNNQTKLETFKSEDKKGYREKTDNIGKLGSGLIKRTYDEELIQIIIFLQPIIGEELKYEKDSTLGEIISFIEKFNKVPNEITGEEYTNFISNSKQAIQTDKFKKLFESIGIEYDTTKRNK